MMQKAIIGILALTIIGAVGIGVYDSTRATAQDEPAASVISTPVMMANTVANVDVQPQNTLPEITPEQTANPAPAAIDNVGEPWSAAGTIRGFDDNGMSITLESGASVYVELGPATYWQAQEASLNVGDFVRVDGFFNGEQIHAMTVTNPLGAQLALRTMDGAPLWSGGAQGNSGGNEHTTGDLAVVAPEDWITLTGVIAGLTNGSITVQTETGETVTPQTGQPRFWQDQGVALAVGDAVSLLGFWQESATGASNFILGEITKTATGERIMLRDPNGRQLWGGPGRNGQASTGQAGNGQADAGTIDPAQNTYTQRNTNQNQIMAVPATEWITVNGIVTWNDSPTITLKTVDGTLVTVNVGDADLWTAQGLVFPVGESLTINGYWIDTVFEAAAITFNSTGLRLELRDTTGLPLWGNTQSNNNGQGNQGQGNQGQGNDSQGNQGQGNQGQGGNQYRGGK